MGTFIVKKNKSGKYMFNLKAGNGAVVATSQAYGSQKACENGIESVRECAINAAVEDQTVSDYTTEKNPKFEIFKDKQGQFCFRLKASNGEIIVKSESYTVKASCKNGINSIIKNAPDAIVIKEF